MPNNNSLQAASQLTLSSTLQTQSDSVTASAPAFYRFTLVGRSSLNLTLTGLSGNADLSLLDINGNVIQQSLNQGTLVEAIDRPLEAGTYYVQVSLGAGSQGANYALGYQSQSNPQTDIVWRNYANGNNTLWQFTGTTLTNAPVLQPISDVNWKLEATGDFNRDGSTDWVIRNSTNGEVRLWYFIGSSFWYEQYVGNAGTYSEIRGAGDFNYDGNLDLVLRDGAGGNRVWFMAGGTYTGEATLPALPDLNWSLEGVGDFNQDGWSDLVWRNYVNGSNAVWFLSGTSYIGGAALPTLPDINWQIQGITDFNHDGSLDLILRNQAHGGNTAWLLSGTSYIGEMAIPGILDVNWKAKVTTRYDAPPPIDLAGNSEASAFSIGSLRGYGQYTDTVGDGDDDYYSFSLAARGQVNLYLWGGVTATLSGNGTAPISQAATGGLTLTQRLNPGTYYVRVSRAAEASGYWVGLLGDLTPLVPSGLSLDAASDSGVSQIDRITNDTTPTLRGQAEPGTTVAIYQGGTWLGQAATGADGNWAVTTGALANGSYNLTARATNGVGDTSAASAALALLIDAAAPGSPQILNLLPAGRYAVTLRGNAEVGSQVQLFEGNVWLGQATTDANGTWQVTTRQLSNGSHQVTATATDLAGNVSPQSAATTVTINTLVPAAPQGLKLTADTDSGQSQTDNITSNLSPTVSGTAEAGATVRLLQEQQLLGQTIADTDGSWSIALDQPLSAGTHTLSAIASNANGDSAAATLSVTIDPLAPTAQINTLASGSTTTAALSSGTTLTTGMRLVGQVNGTLSAVASLQYQLGSQAAVTIPVAESGLFTQVLDLNGLSGSQNLTLSAIDVAGNATTLVSYTVTVDATGSGSGNVPLLLAQLIQDTGEDTTDGWTSLPGVAGVVSAAAPIAGLWGKFDNVTGSAFADLSTALDTNGTFNLGMDQLADLAGGALADGVYALHLQARTDSNQTVDQVVNFTLDTTAPVLTLSSLLDGVAWERGAALQGTVEESLNEVEVSYQIVEADSEAVVAQHSLSLQGSGANRSFDEMLAELAVGDNTLAEEEPYNLVLTSTDKAGNSQRSSFQFFVASDRLVTDDDPWVPDSGTTVRDPAPTSSPTPSNPRSWGYYGGSSGGGWSYYDGNGGSSPGYNGTPVTPTVKSNNNPVVAGAAYEYQYVEGLSKIVDRAVELISTAPQTVNEKAALKNRTNVLLALGSRIDALIQPGGFTETKDQALITQMGSVMEGLFADAYDARGLKAGIFQGYENWAGAWLAQQLVNDSLDTTNPVSVRVQVFQATLLEVVSEVFWAKGITMTTDQQQAVTAAVKELAQTYAWLKPTAEASVPTEEADYGFLDLLWRLQIPGADGKFKGAAIVQSDLGKAVAALGRLLNGVSDPIQAVQFLNSLVQAETDVASLKGSVKEAQFLRENVKFGFEVAKIGMTTSTTSADEAASSFLNTLLKDGNTKQAQAGVGQFFAGLNTTQERVKSLQFADRLMDAAQLTTTLEEQKKDARFISQLVGLGSSYASLNPQLTNSQDVPNLFLDTLWRGGSDGQTLSKASGELTQFLNEVSTSTSSQLLEHRLELLQFENKLFKSIRLVSDFQRAIQNPSAVSDITQMAKEYYLDLEQNPDLNSLPNNFFASVLKAKSKTDLEVAAHGFQEWITVENGSLNGDKQLATNVGIDAITAFCYIRPDICKDASDASIRSLLTVYLTQPLVAKANSRGYGSPSTTTCIFQVLSECLRQGVSNLAEIAYMLATSEIEASLGAAIVEPVGNKGERLDGETDVDYFNRVYDGYNGNRPGTNDGSTYRGQGYAHLTGRGVYEQFTWTLEDGRTVNLRDYPDLVRRPSVAAYTLVNGVVNGKFTGGNGLGYYALDGSKETFRVAREIVYGSSNDPNINRFVEAAVGYLSTLQQFLFKGG